MSTSAASILLQARLRAGLTQAQLGASAGVTQSVISAYEAGKREPALTTLQRLVLSTGFQLELALTPRPMSSAHQNLLATHRDELVARLGELGASNVRVFGSVARGADTATSDVDLLVDLDAGVGLFGLARLQSESERILGVPVDIVPANSLKPRIAQTVLTESRPL
ncbi:nucleotidyltransferase domain-containing protein [Cryobacterium sp. PH31-L1]|uniref:nucleotidyltransferase domain-containing protein n=1 Tax=Cryobacterium sp. PH31-L1 TaxID=3046199 RepID=UPI0024BA5E81|nr:nucleotidyltransferase domain-containing protein [Cryobacterium sp. PH31-L1]MDJ0376830.1 helix-turn-helix domain-containing protein [Cryobacterium sp. PH31-L1]